MRRRAVLGPLLVVAIGLAGAAACSDDGDGGGRPSDEATESGAPVVRCEPDDAPSAANTQIQTALTSSSVDLGAGTVAPGTVAFTARIEDDEPHGLVVVRAGSDGDLPVTDGAVDLDALDDGAILGEVSPFPADRTCVVTFEMEAGRYLVLSTSDDAIPREAQAPLIVE